MKTWIAAMLGAVSLAIPAGALAASPYEAAAVEGDFVAKNFKFASGESLPALKLHYRTLGKPMRDAEGHVTNAVMVLHGTGGSGAQFLSP